ncbi:MAG TPA: SpoIIE family protein phosphatase [Burkholderiales bacterium]|nr:SpoIIE family protein phosphatase [Burkholderiales bacterium]
MERPPHLAVPLNILLVEDAAAERVLLESYLKGLGHNVQTAHHGGQAVQLFDEDRVDLVLMDVVMPVVDGIRATREIKAKCAKQWVPVILLSALGAQTDQAHGLEAGADDYLPKPVNLQLLDAKLRSFQRIVQTTRLLARKREEAEAEMALATALMERLVLRQHALSDPALTWVVHPSSRFSGDVVAAARSPSGRLIAMLADAAGHGLPAAITLLPMVQVFYGMVPKDLPLTEVATEMNRRLSQYVPTGLYMAAVLLSIDPAHGRAEIWNGGMPAGLWIRDGGEALTPALRSRHLPLGILGSREFDSSCTTIDIGPGGHLLFLSDGVLEAMSETGEEFGGERLRKHLLGRRAEDGFKSVVAAIEQHLVGVPAHDDISIMMIRLG